MSLTVTHGAHGDFRANREDTIFRIMLHAAVRQRTLFLSVTLAVPLVFYLVLLALLVMRFGNLPNYVTPYDWFGNVARIIASTGSVSDMAPIILGEWLLEIGYMNYAFGHGVSEWSLTIIPHKIAIMTVIGALLGLNVALIADQEPADTTMQQDIRSVRSGLLTSIGTMCASVTSISLFWVVCHSSPSWVVGLAILGVEVSTTLALEPIGPAISLIGLALLVLSALLNVRDNRMAAIPIRSQPGEEATSC